MVSNVHGILKHLQNLNKAKSYPTMIENEIEKARVHLNWCLRLYRKQTDLGAYFLQKHPRLATPWHEPEIEKILKREGVSKVIADQCQLGEQTDEGDPLKTQRCSCPTPPSSSSRTCTNDASVVMGYARDLSVDDMPNV